MLETKVFEVLDVGTFIPVVGILMKPVEHDGDERERYLLRRAGYSYAEPHCVLLTPLAGRQEANCDPYDWPQALKRTMGYAHHYITLNWDKLKGGEVIDVEYILGESEKPKESESQYSP